MNTQTNAQRLAEALDAAYPHIHVGLAPSAAAELRRLEYENLNMDRLLRCSVPDRWKSCTSPVGAVQSYIAELEADAVRVAPDAPAVARDLLADWDLLGVAARREALKRLIRRVEVTPGLRGIVHIDPL